MCKQMSINQALKGPAEIRYFVKESSSEQMKDLNMLHKHMDDGRNVKK